MPTPETISAFASWWASEFPGENCPPCPKSPDELSFTAQLHMRGSNPALFQSLFSNGGQGSAPMPADTVARRNLGQCIAADIPHLEAAGLQYEAHELKRKAEIEETRLMNQRIDESRQVQAMQAKRLQQWQNMSLLERMAASPVSEAAAAKAREQWGITS